MSIHTGQIKQMHDQKDCYLANLKACGFYDYNCAVKYVQNVYHQSILLM